MRTLTIYVEHGITAKTVTTMSLREHIPVAYDKLFKSILSFASRPKVIFSLGHMMAQPMPNCYRVASI